MWCHAVWREVTNVLMRQVPLQHAARSSETPISVDQTVRCHITEGKASRCYEYSKFVYEYHVLEYSQGKICIVLLIYCLLLRFVAHSCIKHGELIQNLVLNIISIHLC